MSSTQKRGFRLPWATETGPDHGAAAATLDPVTNEMTGAVRDDIGEGPFRLADDAPTQTTDAVPAASDVPATAPEAAMIDIDSTPSESTAAAPAKDNQSADPPSGGWPSTDRASADARPPIRVNGESRLPRRDNPLVAGLVKAMRGAAIASRDETTARLEAEAQARVEAIRARATDEAAGLRKRADEDVSSIREWSKAEIARVKQETDDRIEARRAELAAENERHSAGVDRLVEEVQTTVAAFEAEMDEFFKRLLEEDDPARLATLAEQAPDPPDLRGDGPPATYFADGADEGPADGLHATAAAEAEAEATEGLDPSAAESWPTAALAAARRVDPVTSPADANGPDATRLFVTGLTSVAGISAFKGALGQLAGVRSVSVSSGEPGVFVFAVNHDPGVDLDSGVSGLAGFGATVTDATNDGFTVVARELGA